MLPAGTEMAALYLLDDLAALFRRVLQVSWQSASLVSDLFSRLGW